MATVEHAGNVTERVSSLQASIAEALEELADIQSSSQEMMDTLDCDLPRTMQNTRSRTQAQSQSQSHQAQSAWARTTTLRVGIPCHAQHHTHTHTHHPQESVHRVVTPISPTSSTQPIAQKGFTIAKAARTTETHSTSSSSQQNTPASNTYDPHITALSTKKRTRGFTIMASHKQSQPPPQHLSTTTDIMNNTSHTTAKHHVVNPTTTKVYSFGKAKKNTNPAAISTMTHAHHGSHCGDGGDGDAGISHLDVERAARYLYERPLGGTFAKESKEKLNKTHNNEPPGPGPAPAPAPAPVAPSSHSGSTDSGGRSASIAGASSSGGGEGSIRGKSTDSEDGIATDRQMLKRMKPGKEHTCSSSGSTDSHIEQLSHHQRTLSVKMCPAPSSKNILPKHKKDHSDYGTPGPGAYDVTSASASGATSKSSSSGRGQGGSFAATPHAIPLASRAVLAQQKHRPSPGPGEYCAPSSAAAGGAKEGTGTGKGTGKGTGTAAFTSLVGESKPTPQLLKKRYFEEKARDMREETGTATTSPHYPLLGLCWDVIRVSMLCLSIIEILITSYFCSLTH